MLTLLTGLALAAAAQSADTTVPVQRGQRLEVSAHAGSVRVRAWNRDAVRVTTRSTDDAEVEVRSRGSRVSVDASGPYGRPVDAALEISAPAWMPIGVNGVDLDVTVEGAAAAVAVETVQGDVIVSGGNGLITLGSVEGSVRLRGARGKIQISSVNDDVEAVDAAGDLSVSTVNGDVRLERIDSENVDASTVNGDIGFSGPIRSGGRYSLSSHNGDLTVTVAEGTSAVVSVGTFSGDFETAFPVTVSNRRRGQRFSFTLGGGAARLELDSFQGDIRLVRPGAAITPR